MGISVWQVVILLAVVLLIFGTKKLKTAVRDDASIQQDISPEVTESVTISKNEIKENRA